MRTTFCLAVTSHLRLPPLLVIPDQALVAQSGVFVCMCVYVCVHLPDLACAAQSEVCGVMCVCVCVYTSSRPSLCHSVRCGCPYSGPGCRCSLSCERHDVFVCAYILQTRLSPLTQVCVVFVCICVVRLFAYVCWMLHLSLSTSLYFYLSVSETGKIINDEYIGGQTLIRFIYIIYIHAHAYMHVCVQTLKHSHTHTLMHACTHIDTHACLVRVI